MSYVIGIDLGTQSLKGVLVNPEGAIIAEATCTHDPAYPQPGWAEQHVEDYIRSFTTVVQKLIQLGNIPPQEVGTIGVDAINDSVIPVDKYGVPLMNCIIWMDRRAEAEIAEIAENIDADKAFGITGLNLDSTHTAAKMLWIKKQRPEIFERTEYILNVDSFLVAWMTGEFVVDYAQASASMIYNVSKMGWDDEMCKAFGLDPAQLGRINKAEEIVGHLTPTAASRLGLTVSTKVITGTGDEHSACLGSGLVEAGMVCDITGTAEPVAATSDKPVFDIKGKLVETHHSAYHKLWLIENPGFVSGGATRWFKDHVLESKDYDLMNIQARRSSPGSNGLIFLPCMGGAMTPTWNGAARGTFAGLSLSHTIDDMSRAVFEGIAYGVRDNVERFEEIGINCSSIRIVGGGTKSPLWCQMKADILGKTLVSVKNPEGAAIGAAMLASVAEGNFASLEDAAKVMVELGDVYEPDLSLKSQYDEAYHRYFECYHAMEPFFTKHYS
ncbi:MAG: hypothetical protein K6C05_04055 [Anaerovibrio sp.]|uniref:xylulokinase n=1 Tax=Anaerovibrio sp. TaxID=1872532 RepID=UPI0025F011C9|nr:FGGY family carbohydrate kinase [Anaerovibrio sp.]MCR5176002.1 hypothetical protein [Anaerovibrio sp.]